MVLVIAGVPDEREAGLLEQCFRLRHRVFVEELGWEALRRPDGREVDQFDTSDAIHILDVVDGRIAAYGRLLPTTKPHLLSDVMPEILGGADPPVGPDIYEWTRLCIAPEHREGRSAMNAASRRLWMALVEFCLLRGIRAIVGETNPIWITRLLELGWNARPLALPVIYDGQPVVALYAGVSERTLQTSRTILGFSEPLLMKEVIRIDEPVRPGRMQT